MNRPLSSVTLFRSVGDVLRTKSFPSYSLGYVFLKHAEAKYIQKKFSKETGLPASTKFNKKYKNSSTLFILGSGSSVNSYNENKWDTIRNHDSIGLNFWPIHDFTPDYYTFELPREERMRNCLYELLNIKSDEYSDVPILLKNISTLSNEIEIGRLPREIVSNIYLSSEVPIPWDGNNSKSLSRGCHILRRLGYFSPGKIDLLPHLVGSISYLTSFALKMGYESIVLCGVDLNNPEYFYTDESDYYKSQGIPLPKESVDTDVHKTIDEGINDVTIIDVINAINSEVCSNRNVDLFIGSEKSALHPELDYYW